MKKDKFQITMPELQKLIKEEYSSMAKKASRAGEIQNRLKAINEELETLPETLSEVEAGGLKGVKSTGWTGAGEEDKKYDEKFEKIGTHLKEDEEIEGEMEMGGEEESMGGPEMGEPEMEAPEMGYFELKFAELGKELDAKVGGEEMDMEVEAGDGEEMEVEMGVEENVEMASNDSVASEGLSEEVEVEEEVVAEEMETEEEAEIVSEDLEEPIEGKTPAQDSDARFNDYMEKDKHVKESVNAPGAGVLSEGYSTQKKTALSSELERMKRLAKL